LNYEAGINFILMEVD